MQPEPELTQAALAYLMETVPVLVLRLDAHQRIGAANVRALRVLGPDVVGRTLTEITVDFVESPKETGDGAQLLSLKTASGVPESFYFRRFGLPDGSLAVGSPDFAGLERMRTEVLCLNRELSNIARQLHVANAELSEKNAKLAEALDEVKVLSGLLPICSSCKKIRDDKGYWNHVEVYIEKHSGARFTHGMCPDCLKAMYGDLAQPPD